MTALPWSIGKLLPRHLRRRVRIDDSGCWPLSGVGDKDGYSHARGLDGKTWQAHRLVYTLLVGPIPESMTLDHLCRVRPCVNPAHMRVVPHEINASRRPPEKPEPGQIPMFDLRGKW